MNATGRFAEIWFAWIVPASWQLCVLVAIVAMASRVLRRASARLRYGLWLLVLVKALLPPTLSAPWSLGNTMSAAVWDRTSAALRAPFADGITVQTERDARGAVVTHGAAPWWGLQLPAALALGWAVGCVGLWGFVGWRYLQLARTMSAAEPIDEGPARVALEHAALSLDLANVPHLLVTDRCGSPFLVGVFSPRIVIARSLLGEVSDDDLRAVLLHELVHWKRRDTWVGWLQILVQGMFWFHPFVWWANHQLRNARESACDESVLQLERVAPRQYGEVIVRILTASRGRSLVAGSMVGVFERGTNLQHRVEDIMNYETTKRHFGWTSRAAVALFAGLFLPMAASVAEVAPDGAQPAADQLAAVDDNAGNDAQDPSETPYPRIVRTEPEQGATGVDPSIGEISITFDRPMEKGMSWTGEPPLFPPLDKSNPPRWKDDTTCVLPVQLKRGQSYRLGINSSNHTNFRGEDGTPTPCDVIAFTTVGASKSIENRLRVPQIVEIEPANGEDAVDPGIKALRVTFDMPMGEGMSWTGGGPEFPEIPKGARPHWSSNGRTCILPVALKPNATYRLGLNSLNYINFQSKWGIPSSPVEYRFATGASK